MAELQTPDITSKGREMIKAKQGPILVVVDYQTCYPEAVVVEETGVEDNIHAFSEIFSQHGFPRHLHSDNVAPFNVKDSYLLQQYSVTHITNYIA